MRLRLEAIRRRAPALATALAPRAGAGGLVEIPDQEWRHLRAGAALRTSGSERERRIHCVGFGDLLFVLLTPMRRLGLRHCSRCARRRQLLNRWLRLCWG